MLISVESAKYMQIITDVQLEVYTSYKKYGPQLSPHEGYAIIKEELDELFDEIRRKPGKRNKSKMRNEAKQIASAAIRFMLDLT